MPKVYFKILNLFLALSLLRLSAKGEVIIINLRNLLKEIYEETGKIFAKSEYGVVFESFFIIDGDDICNPVDKVVGCAEGYNAETGICASVLHKPIVPILIPSQADSYSDDFNPFPGNIFTIASILPTIKLLPGIKKSIIVKFRRDFGNIEMTKHWIMNLKYERFKIKNELNNEIDYGICDIIK